jgi:ABC-type histidine transport system ATPase subunit
MNKKIVYWKQRNGELISIDDMDINHLRNVLKMIIKNNNNPK